MGLQNSKFINEQELPQQFIPVKGLAGIYQSIINGSRLQKHKIELSSEAGIGYEKELFIFRRMHAERIVSASFFEKLLPSHLCNMSYEVTFFTQHHPETLSANTILSSQRTFKILVETLQGFQILFTKFGAFTVGFHNIFFNSHKEAKVWISSNFGKTRLEKCLKAEIDQQKMVLSIFRLFDQIKDQRNNTTNFTNCIEKFKDQQGSSKITFKTVLKYLIQQASKYFQRRTKKPESLQFEKSSHLKLQYSNNKSVFNEHFPQQKIQIKDKKSTNTISLKSKSKRSNVPFQLNHKQNISDIQPVQRFAKPRRHNSQEDYYTNREINLYKKQNKNMVEHIQIIPNPRNTHQNVIHNTNEITTNTMRNFRKSTDEVDYNHFIQQHHQHHSQSQFLNQHQQQQLITMKRYEPQHLQIPIKRIKSKPMMQNRQHVRFNNILQTQHNREEVKLETKTKMAPQTDMLTFKNLQFEDPKNSTATTSTKIRVPYYEKQKIENLCLAELKTLQSILNSEYSNVESLIVRDSEHAFF